MHYIVYKITNLVNSKIYIGVHKTTNLNDGYMGSSKYLENSINKYGIENFCKKVLYQFKDEFNAYLCEEIIVDQIFIDRSDTYNIKLGGIGGWSHRKNRFIAKDKFNKKYDIFIDDPRYLSGELVGIAAGCVIIKDKNGNKFQVDKDDLRYLSGELVSIHKNKTIFKDKSGNNIYTHITNPKVISGELVGHSAGFVTVKDKSGNTMSVTVDDPRYLSGELVHVSKGTNFKIKNIKMVKCPHCGKEGRPTNMYRWHFDKCKMNPNREEYDMLTCPHCNKTGTIANMKRWHFDNCKFNLL